MPYLKHLFSGIKSEVNRDLFDTVVSAIENQIKKRPADEHEKEEGIIYLNDNSITEIMKEFSETLSSPLFSYNKIPVSLNDFLFYLKFDIIKLSKTSWDDIRAAVKKKVDAYIEQDILASEAFKKGLDKDDSVVKELAQWKESYLSQMLRNDFLKSAKVSDDEVYQYYWQSLIRLILWHRLIFLRS